MNVNVTSATPVQEIAAAPVAGLASLLDLFRAASEQDRAAFAAVANLAPAAPVAAKKSAGRPKKAAAAVAVSLPEAGEDGAPSAEDYRLKEEEIKMDSCLGRRHHGGPDKRWKPAVYRETQCGGKNVEGSTLCETCTRRLQKYVEAPKAGDWTGLVTEEPLDWMHMLGTQWAADKQPKWVGVITSASGSEASSEAGEVAAAPKVSRAEAAAAKAQERAQATIARAQKKADEASAKALQKAEATAAKAAEKAAAKAAEKASKPKVSKAKASASSASAAAAPAPAPQEAAASTAAAPVTVVGEMRFIDGTFYMIKDGYVFEFDSDSPTDVVEEAIGKCVGKLTADGESIEFINAPKKEEEEEETPIAE
jgi:hypothetical protein